MAKAWRLNAHKINELRRLERELRGYPLTPPARQLAKVRHQSVGKAVSYPLLTALLVRAGVMPAPLTLLDKFVRAVNTPITKSKSWLGKWLNRGLAKLIRA